MTFSIQAQVIGTTGSNGSGPDIHFHGQHGSDIPDIEQMCKVALLNAINTY